MTETYVSVDIEADGPIPSTFSMLSFGAVAFNDSGKELDSFYAVLQRLPGARQDDATMKWWSNFPEAYALATENPLPPDQVMRSYRKWLEELPGRKTFVAYPAGFDFTFMHWYLMHFTEGDPCGFQALDMKTFAMARLGTRFHYVTKRTMPKAWFEGINRGQPHNPVDDARAQGELFFRMRDWVSDC